MPGGTIPRELGLSTRVAVEISSFGSYPDAIERLCTAIGHRRQCTTEFEILVGVDSSGPVCCVAHPFNPDPKLSEAMKAAVALVALPTLRLLQSHDGTSPESYHSDVADAVRKCSVLLADCSPCNASGVPDSNVAYQMGLAKSLGKPVVMVTKSPLNNLWFSRTPFSASVEFNPADFAADEPVAITALAERISVELTNCLRQLSPPYLVANNQEGIGVARAQIYSMRGTFWKHFERLQRFGLKVHHASICSLQ